MKLGDKGKKDPVKGIGRYGERQGRQKAFEAEFEEENLLFGVFEFLGWVGDINSIKVFVYIVSVCGLGHLHI